MANTKQTEPRYMEVDVPQEVMNEVAEIVGKSKIDAYILGIDEDDSENISIHFTYTSEERDNMMAILELVEDHNSDDDDESEEN